MITRSDKLARIGSGSVGGKGRALGYLNLLVDRPDFATFPRTTVKVPRATVITTSEFEQFVEDNDLWHCLTSHDDEVVLHAFARGRFSSHLFASLRRYAEEHTAPLAVRSSSLNEDAYDHPFAGLYKTVLLPNSAPDVETRLKQLTQAIKLVFASTYLNAPKAYMRRFGLPLEDEAMAVILQELAGQAHRTRFYPRLAGVAQSLNYFPVGQLTAQDGVCRLVVGLGQRAMSGDEALWFAPRKPLVRPDHHSPRRIAEMAQKAVDVLDLSRDEVDVSADERSTIKSLPLDAARKDNLLGELESWWNREDDTLYEGGLTKGEPILTFNRLLKGELFPFTDVLTYVLERAVDGFRGPVEIEFAADMIMTPEGCQAEVNLLQARRIGRPQTGETVELRDTPPNQLLLTSSSALGNGVDGELTHIVYIAPGARSPEEFVRYASEIGRINARLAEVGGRYLLIAPGRFGSRNRALGIPVTFNHIFRAAGLVEVSSPDFVVEPSQGTHFFQNLAAGHVFYLSVNISTGDVFDRGWFERQPDSRGLVNPSVKLIELQENVVLRVDGRTQRAQLAVQPPGSDDDI